MIHAPLEVVSSQSCLEHRVGLVGPRPTFGVPCRWYSSGASLHQGAVMLDAVLSFIRSVLWAVNVALAIIILAVLVAPVSTATNMASWLSVVGLTKQADWLIAHAHSGLHFSAHPLVAANASCDRFVCAPLSSAFEVTLSVIA